MTFQNFAVATCPETGPLRLAALRVQLMASGLDGFLVPRADRHQGEYVAPCDERLAWLTGFTGSAGFACVLPDIAGVFVDGRYRIQVRDQVADVFTPVDWPETRLGDWLVNHAKAGQEIGFDPWLHSVDEIAGLTDRLNGTGIELRAVVNQIDLIWNDRPPRPDAPAWAHPIEHSGQKSGDKRTQLAKGLKQAGHKAAVLTLTDSINWLLNIRGGDIPRTPVVQAFAIVHDNGRVNLFSDVGKFTALGPDPDIDLADWDAFETALAAFDGPVLIDPKSAPFAVAQALGDRVVHGDDPCALPKACKNAVELSGARAAHLRDGAAMCNFLAWFDGQDHATLSEIDVVRALEGFRRENPELHDISFETIAGSGPNAAIVHYRVSEESNRTLDHNSLLLLDSGAQYPDGTTDLTRTLPLGQPDVDMRTTFTRVLQGMIALSLARFPKGVAGAHLDALARAPLWQVGLDYDHGTGHGVGSFLSVHEGPQRISRTSSIALEVGMIVSNEPGYYRTGAFGIRIENLIVVQNAPKRERDMLCFETLTLVPIDRRLIVVDMLAPQERDWINAYHAQVYDSIAPLVDKNTRDWLKSACDRI